MPASSSSALSRVLPWHGRGLGLRRLWRAQPFPRRKGVWGTTAFGVAAFVLGVVGFMRIHVDGTPDSNLGTAIYNSISLYTLTFNVPGGAKPDLALWIAAFAAPLTTARVLFQLLHDRISRFVIRRLLRGHVIVCGGGFRGAFLANKLAAAGEIVVLVDLDEQSRGLVESRQHNVWPLVGDATSPEVLRRAGGERASRIVAITSDDYVNASIAAAAGRVPPASDAEVFVHVDDPAVTRIVDAPLSRGGRAPIPFSTASRAAAATIDHAADAAFEQAGRADRRASIVIFGDDTVIDAMVLELHRRWQMAILGGADRTLQPLVTVFAPNATDRLRALRNRHGHPLEEIDLVAHDIDMDFGTSLDGETTRLLRGTLPINEVWVVDRQPLSALRLALTVSHIIGSRYKVRLLSQGSIDELTQAVEAQTLNDDAVADILPACLVELALGESTLDDGRRAARLAYANGLPRDADDSTKQAAIAAAQQHLDHAGSVIDEPAPVANRWHADVHDALGLPAPSVFIRAGLRVDALTAQTAHAAGPALIRRAGQDEHAASRDAALAAAFTYYARVATTISDPDSRLFEGLLDDVRTSTDGEHRLKEDIVVLLELRRKSLRLQTTHDARPGAAPPASTASTAKPIQSSRASGAVGESDPAPPIPQCFASIAGGAPTWDPAAVTAAADALVEALAAPAWRGVLVNSEAGSGAAAVVAAVGDRTDVHTLAYVPKTIDGAPVPPLPGFDEIRTGHRDERSIAEPLRAWSDLLKLGVDPRTVPVLVYPGSATSSEKLALAVAMGAPVAIVDIDPAPATSALAAADAGTRRMAAETSAPAANSASAPDADSVSAPTGDSASAPTGDSASAPTGETLAELYDNATGVAPLPNDAGALRAFLRPGDALAILGVRVATDAGAEHGKALQLELPSPFDPAVPFADPALERLASLLHGQDLLAQIRDGWDHDERPPLRLLTPVLTPWRDLAPKAQAAFREAVVALPATLAADDQRVVPLTNG